MRTKNRRHAINEQLENAGRILTEFRARTGYSLNEAAKELEISASFLSEVENGIKIPSDILIRNLAKLYDVEEAILFKIYGKIPLGVREELESNSTLQELITEIVYSNKLSEDQKQELYSRMHRLYQDYIH